MSAVLHRSAADTIDAVEDFLEAAVP